MQFLRSPLTWILLALGIWLNCEYNYKTMQYQGVNAVTTPMLAQQALMGTAVLVAIVCGVASASGDKFTWTEEGEDGGGKAKAAVLVIVLVIAAGFLLNSGINFFDPPTR